MSKDFPDFTDTELWIVKQALKERYRKDVEPELADSEIKIYPDDQYLTTVPALFWQEHDVGFVILKTGESRFRSMFYYSVREQYGTGKPEYDDIAECVSVLLKLQADHEADRAEKQG
jgi:hypothetical protein